MVRRTEEGDKLDVTYKPHPEKGEVEVSLKNVKGADCKLKARVFRRADVEQQKEKPDD